MTEREILLLIEELKECFGNALLITNSQNIMKIVTDPELALSQQNKELRQIALTIYTIFQVLKKREIIHFSTRCSERPFFLEETETHRIVHVLCNGADMRYIENKATGECEFDNSDVLRSFGINDVDEFLSSDEGLDIINDIMKEHPEIQLFGKGGLFAKNAQIGQNCPKGEKLKN